MYNAINEILYTMADEANINFIGKYARGRRAYICYLVHNFIFAYDTSFHPIHEDGRMCYQNLSTVDEAKIWLQEQSNFTPTH